MDSAARFRPRNRCRAAGLNTIETRANLHGPGRLGLLVDFAIEALNQLARKCGTFLGRETQGLSQ
jgi:hypothetical protein